MKDEMHYSSASVWNKKYMLTVHQCGWEKIGKGFAPSIRNHYLIHHVVKGKGYFYRGNQTFTVKENEGFIIFPGETTSYFPDEINQWEYYWVGFSGIEANIILSECGITREKPVFQIPKDALEYMQHILEASENIGEYAMLGNLYLFFSKLIVLAPKSSEDLSSIYTKKVVEYIQNNYSYDISIAKIANYIGVNRSHLFKLFKKNIGYSVNEFLIEYRLKMAIDLLLNSSLTVSQICYSTGFRDANHFSRIFKNRQGVSPVQYRKLKTELQ